jgi:cytoplasmic iron level regulating protein YaaA (DUF328/UPF0246 family)
MLMVISPAKTLDFDTPAKTKQATTPDFLDQSQALIDDLQQLSPADVSELMGISEKLALLNVERYMNWQQPFDSSNAKQALLAFKGDVYTGLEAESFSSAEFKFAQKHLRILSGLYGLLRPLDLIQPYRLEMGVKFANSAGATLYQFWGEQLTTALNSQLKKSNSELLLNLASNEYFKAVHKNKINGDIITPVFKDLKNGKYKIISFYAKKARGQMAAYVIRQQITAPEDIKAFDVAGYRYNPAMSTAREWLFTRDQPA